MDNNLHGSRSANIHTGKLGPRSPLRNSNPTFIFEPKDFIEFKTAWDWQKDWQNSLLKRTQRDQAIWIIQHEKCYTLGRGASEKNLLFDSSNPPSPLYRIDRGGEVTHHLPGQIVVYLVLDLKRYKMDLNWYLRELEELLLDVLSDLGVVGNRVIGKTGIWVNGLKVASIGIGCRRWITIHGFSININCNMSGFEKIVPCGLIGDKTGRLDYWLSDLRIEDVQPLILNNLKTRFHFEVVNT